MTTISEERVERSAIAICACTYEFGPDEPQRCLEAWETTGAKHMFRKYARAALIADAPAILAAKIEGLKEAKGIVLRNTVDLLKCIDWRIASLEAEMKEGGK